MFDGPAPTHPAAPAPGVALQLPVDAYYHLVRTLRLTLPPPGDGAEDLARRDHAIIAQIAALAPANAAEAELAAQFVAATEQWKDCLRLAQLPETRAASAGTAGMPAKCRAQAAAMMRQANSALTLLQKTQALRHKVEADYPACDRIARIEHVATALMAEALASCPQPGPLPKAEQPASDVPADKEKPAAAKLGADAPELIAGAEAYAAAYPERAAAIRRTGKLPSDVKFFCPPEAALARALISGNTPALVALDTLPIAEHRPACRSQFTIQNPGNLDIETTMRSGV